MARPTIIDFITADSGLARHKAFRHMESWKNWLTFLRTIYAIPFESEEEAASYQHFTARSQPPSAPFEEIWMACGRRGGKSFISATIAIYEALTGRWSERLSGGEAATIYIIACDKQQSRNVFRYCAGLLNVVAPEQILRSTREQIELRNGVEISIRAGNYAALRGASVALALIDEAAYLKDESGNYASPVQEIVRSLKPALIPGGGDDPAGKIIFLSTPRSKAGMMFESFEEYWGRDDLDTICWRGTTQEMHPGYISEAKIAKDLRADPSFYKAEWLGQWRDDVSNLFDVEKLHSAMKDHQPLPHNPKENYIGFIDSSQGRHDSFCFAVGFRYKQSDQIVIARTWEWMAPFQPSEIVAECAAAAREYHCGSLYADANSIGWVEEEFMKHRILVNLTKQSKSQLYVEFQGLVQLGKCWLVNDRRAEQQFLQLERSENRDGSWRVDHPKYGNAMDDLANAIAGCAVTIFKEARQMSEAQQQARLPKMSGHQIPKDTIIYKQMSAREKRRDMENLMDDFMKSEGCSRIVR